MPDPAQNVVLTLAECRPAVFQPMVNQTLTFANSQGEAVILQLLEVTVKPRGGHSRDPFSLLFALESGEIPPDCSLRPRMEGFADEPWFINRVSVLGGEPGVRYCEAVFG